MNRQILVKRKKASEWALLECCCKVSMKTWRTEKSTVEDFGLVWLVI